MRVHFRIEGTMRMDDDWNLLDAYAKQSDEAAFRELVVRHVNMVYGTARRMLGVPGAEAEDVTQAVFLLLSQRAAKISRRGALLGWLYRATKYCCANVRKGEGRRRKHERKAAMNTSDVERLQEDLSQMLDEALAGLGEKERQAILVRYMEQKTSAETGAVLGISEAAVEKRLERGVEKLRKYFAKCGYAVPAAAILSAEAKAVIVPVGLIAKIGGDAGSTSTAAGIAKGAAVMMKAASVKILAMGTIVVVVLAGGAIIVAADLRARPAEQIGGRAVGMGADENVMFVRWDEVVRDGGAARVIGAGLVKPTTSVGYTVIETDAEKVRDALREAAGRGELLAMDNAQIGWASLDERMPQTDQNDFGIFAHVLNGSVRLDEATSINVTAGEGEKAFLEPRRGVVRVRLPGELRETWLQSTDSVVTKNLKMAYAGDVPVGRAVVFVGDLGKEAGAEIYHVSVWEAFSCSEAEWPYLQHADQIEWREGGAKSVKVVADRALGWEQAGHAVEPVAPKWERTLENGAVVRVLAVKSVKEWPYCWWDAEGNAVKAPPAWLLKGMGSGDKDAEIEVAIGIEDPHAALVPRLGFAMHNNVWGNPRQAVAILKLVDGGVEVGIAAGPWTTVGEMKVGQTVEGAGMKAVVEKVEQVSEKTASMAGSCWLHEKILDTGDCEGEVAALDKTGQEDDHPHLPSAVIDRKDRRKGYYAPTLSMVYLAAADIAKMELRVRQRSWVRFDGIAMTPRVNPGTVQSVAVKKPAATEPLPTATQAGDRLSPEGMTRMFMSAIRAQDAEGARKLMYATSPEEHSYADAMVNTLVANDALYSAAVKRFGEKETQEALVRTWLCSASPSKPEGTWKLEGDKATFVSSRQNVVMTGGPGSSLIRVNGLWCLDMSLPKDLPEEQRQSLPRQVAMQKAQAAAQMEVAKAIAAGKYADAYAARDALTEARKKVLPGG